MSFIKNMQNRYTTKVYDKTKKIDLDKIEELKEILRLSPSSINSQPWKFTFVSNKEIKNKLAEASFFNKERIENCQVLIVFSRIDDINIFEKQIKKELPKGANDYYFKFLKQQPENQIKHWFEKQVYLSLGILLSACSDMKIDSTPMEGIEVKKYDKILNLKEYTSLVAVAIGYRDNNDSNQPSKNPKSRIEQKQVINSI